jgi:hypothetical protein
VESRWRFAFSVVSETEGKEKMSFFDYVCLIAVAYVVFHGA